MGPRRYTTIFSTMILVAAGTGGARGQDGGAPLEGGAPLDGGAPGSDAAAAGDAGPPVEASTAAEAGVMPEAGVTVDLQPAAPVGLPTDDLEPGADMQTGIRGRVVDRKTGAPLVGAAVSIVGQDTRTRSLVTDTRGAYRAHVPPGTYTVRARYDFYHGARLERVRVTRGKFDQVNLVLDPIDIEEDVVVMEIEIPYRADTTTAAAQDQLRRESTGIGEGMGAKQMSQQGASDAASAAKRVVGVTVDRSQLVVRGLGGRYVKVFLNGMPIPNTDPDFPSVDLDLFPTNVIDSLNVHKAYLPDLPGEFAGGVLDITTVSFPRKFTLEAGASMGLDSQTSFRERLTHQGGAYDGLGFDDGVRALPPVARGQRLAETRDGPFQDQQALNTAAQTFSNVWQYRRTDGLPKIGADLTLGDAVKMGRNSRFGYLTALVYDYSVERQVGRTRPKPGATDSGDAQEANNYYTETGGEAVQLAAIATASLDIGTDHSFTVLTMFNRVTEEETKYRDGINTEVSQTARYQKWQLQYLARTLLLNQVLGDHRNLFGTRLRLRWGAYYGLGWRDEPDQRNVAYGEHRNVPERWKPNADRMFSDLQQTDLGATTSLRFPLWPEAWATVGGRVGRSDRGFTTRRFELRELLRGAPLEYQSGPEALFGPEGLGRLAYMTEFTKPLDSYVAEQTQLAGFALLETPLVGPLSLAGGARVEVFEQEVSSRSPFPEDNTPESLAMNRTDRQDLDILPGAALKYAITDSMLARAAYAFTVSRPQVRELAPYDYYDFLRDRRIVGNPELQTAHIHNFDLRWEWFFGEGQIVALSGFYKRFRNPIELQIFNDRHDSKYVNAKAATSMGGELELRSDLGLLAGPLRHLSLGGNLSLISSRIELAAEDAGATRAARRLAGQAPYVINLSLHFVRPETPVSGGLVYNVVGPRITDVGARVGQANILPDVEEQPFHSLDALASWNLGKHLKLKLKVRNLLLQRRVVKQGSLVVQETNSAVSGSLGLSYQY